MSPDSRQAKKTARWRKVVCHPVFPILIFILGSQATGEFYPFSPFSMYSNPSPVPMRVYYLAGENQAPLPMTWHTGQSPSSISKKFNGLRGEMREREKKKTTNERLSPQEIDRIAGVKTLQYLRQQSRQRGKKKRLAEEIHLIEIRIGEGPEGLQNTHRSVASLPPES